MTIPFETPPGAPVRWRHVVTHQEGENGESTRTELVTEDTYTICPPFRLSQENDGFENIPAGCPCVYLSRIRIARLEDLEPRQGLIEIPNQATWGIFYRNDLKWRRKIERAASEAREELAALGVTAKDVLLAKLKRRDRGGLH